MKLDLKPVILSGAPRRGAQSKDLQFGTIWHARDIGRAGGAKYVSPTLHRLLRNTDERAGGAKHVSPALQRGEQFASSQPSPVGTAQAIAAENDKQK